MKFKEQFINETVTKKSYKQLAYTAGNIIVGSYESKTSEILIDYLIDKGFLDEDALNDEGLEEDPIAQAYFQDLITSKKDVLALFKFLQSKKIVNSDGVIEKKFGDDVDSWSDVYNSISNLAKF